MINMFFIEFFIIIYSKKCQQKLWRLKWLNNKKNWIIEYVAYCNKFKYVIQNEIKLKLKF